MERAVYEAGTFLKQEEEMYPYYYLKIIVLVIFKMIKLNQFIQRITLPSSIHIRNMDVRWMRKSLH